MRKRLLVPIAAVLAFGLLTAFANTAMAYPTRTTPCSGCHDLSASVHVTASLVSATATSSTYSIGVNNPYGSNGWAVFQGSSKKFGTAGSGTNVTLNNGVAYSIFGVSGNGNGTQGYATLSLTPPVPDLTAPTTTSDALAGYVSSATITLTAHDNVGGSGVAHTYCILDGGPQAEGTTVQTSVIGTHTLEFWSVDTANNVESPHNVVNFEITPPVPDRIAPVTTSDAKATYVGSAAINLTSADNPGGSGVAHTYYVLDGGAQVEGTAISSSVIGTHTLEFWSVDASANVEAPRNVAAFEIASAPPVVVQKRFTYVYKFNVKRHVYKGLHAVLKSSSTHKTYTTTVSKKGVATFKKLPAGKYRLSTKGNAKFKFKARTVRIGL
jgi:hypothetical protein